MFDRDTVADTGRGEEAIHLPSPTYAPLIVSFGITIAADGALYFASTGGLTAIVCVLGLLIMGYGITRWVRASHADAPH
jgi:cytochrome c oxidase subunit 1